MMSMEFGVFKFSLANFNLSDIPHSLLTTNVAVIIPVDLGSTA